jgi:hypothetical protein
MTVLSVEARTVHDLAQERLLICVRPYDLCLGLGWFTMAHKVVFFATDLDLASQEGPHRRGEILGCLGIDKSPKTPLIDVEAKRGEDSR